MNRHFLKLSKVRIFPGEAVHTKKEATGFVIIGESLRDLLSEELCDWDCQKADTNRYRNWAIPFIRELRRLKRN